jgi:hypothetical protein
VALKDIARWDGSSWSAVGDGVVEGVFALAVSEATGEVYVGGVFDQAGGVNGTDLIARWNGYSWSALGSGVSGMTVNAIAINGTDVYVAGVLTHTGGVPVGHVARWDGSSWSALGNGVNGPDGYAYLKAIAVNGNDVYVGGSFSQAGSVVANNIARWDGNTWSALGTGVSDESGYAYVQAIAVSGSDLYVGGGFTEAGGAPARYIAKWDGTSWSSLGERIGNPVTGTVAALAVCGSDLYAGGYWTHNQWPGDCLARWDGTSWSAVGEGTNDNVCAIAVSGSDVYIGGWFDQAGSALARYIARWNGNEWSALGNGLPGRVYAIAVNDATGEVYAGGAFT